MTEADTRHTVDTGYPVIRLRPKVGRRLAHGAPWVYADEVAMDRRARNRAPGTLVRLESAERAALGVAAFNPVSTIALRMLDADLHARIDRDWLEAALRRALALRARLFDAPFYRLVHAEGDFLPGVVIDRFGDAVVVQPNAAWIDAMLPELIAAIDVVIAPETIIVNTASRARALEGLKGETRVLRGACAEPVEVPMNGAVYLADLAGGQKTGLFYDQRPNHAFAARLACDATVLDMFSHVGGFSLAALASGARRAIAVDSSGPALRLAQGGAERIGAAARFETRQAQAFDALRDLAQEERRFDLVVCDPPAFAPAKAALEAGLRAYEKTARLAARLVAPGGFLALCSCSHAVDAERFRLACARGVASAGRAGALIHAGGAGPDHPAHFALPETGYLKALFWKLDG